MSITELINTDIKNAMKAREKEKLAALRAIKAAFIVKATKEGGDGTVSDEAGAQIIGKLFKQRNDAAKIYVEQGREDLAKDEVFQAGVLKVYLPEQMSEDDVRRIIQAVIAQVGAAGPQDMGKVMGASMGKLKGKADGGLISQIVKSELSQAS
ncbi:MAG: GatB/YqeY domain-containing protein [Flavobacteriales bacterium]|nr:GatB/YqeY domain-containing protein [Flavobacteriales bacterium]